MQTKNNKKLPILILLLYIFSSNLMAEEFNISAKEILVDKDNEILTGTGSVEATDLDGNIITADKITYKKSEEFLLAEGNVKIQDKEKNVLLSSKASFDKLNGLIKTFSKTELLLFEGYSLFSEDIYYNINQKIVSSNKKSVFKDIDGNIINTSMFQYDVIKNLFSSVGEIKIIDINKNKYFFKEIYVDTKKKEMIGSEISVILDEENFGLSKENDPRFVANDISLSKNKTTLSKGVFTVCKLRKDKCPPWSIKAKKIIHDKIKKTIYYEKATLKVYDFPIFYFPKFFHPDPTVKRQSGFLAPFLTNSSNVGLGTAAPYYWAISHDRDLTFTPKIYSEENPLFLSEYRQAFKNSFLILDTSYTEGYNNTSSKKTSGSRSHVFANLDIDFNKSEEIKNNLAIKVQQTSNDTYLRIHDIKTSLVNPERTDLENQIKYSFSKPNMYLDIEASVFEDLRDKKNSDKYEYILPNIIYGKTLFSEKFGIIDINSNALYSNFNTNRHKKILTNDVIWSPSSNITTKGFVNTLQGMIRNINYETKKVNSYKDDSTVNELHGVISHKTSLPMKKQGINFTKLFSPNFMIRYSPGHTRNIKSNDINLNYSNIYALNKTSEIEDGLSAVLGIDYKVNEKKGNSEIEKFSLSLGQIFSDKENSDLPAKSSLDQKASDIVGLVNYNFSEIGKIDYKFSLDHNLNDLNYNEVSTVLNFGKVAFNLDYLEQQNHIGNEHYASAGLTLDVNKNNKLSFSTKKNFKTDSTELYDLSYQYGIDCLTAGLTYRREFYQDVDDLEPKNSLLFTITFVPFGNVKTPSLKQ